MLSDIYHNQEYYMCKGRAGTIGKGTAVFMVIDLCNGYFIQVCGMSCRVQIYCVPMYLYYKP